MGTNWEQRCGDIGAATMAAIEERSGGPDVRGFIAESKAGRDVEALVEELQS